ncbi:hypothetical protein BDZ97DRAFT_858719 [Flammula alnicola]|nr:hypothetical protein BDZ97DRAFT_858719 [Flammula alnicola]
MDVRTMVFGMGASGDLRVGYKYVPSLLKEIIFPSPRSNTADDPPARKRRRVQETEDVEMADAGVAATADTTTKTATKSRDSNTELARPVILETAKESYLLSPSAPAVSDDVTESAPAGRSYEIALILETEVVVEEEQPVAEGAGDKAQEQAESDAVEDMSMQDDAVDKDPKSPSVPLPVADEPASVSTTAAAESVGKALSSPSNTAPTVPSRISTPSPRSISPSRPSPVHSPEPEPKDASADGPPSSSPPYAFRHASLTMEEEVDNDKAPLLPLLAVQVLQRNMTENMFRFAEEGVYVLDGSASDGMEEWVIQVKNWKWAPSYKGARERL